MTPLKPHLMTDPEVARSKSQLSSNRTQLQIANAGVRVAAAAVVAATPMGGTPTMRPPSGVNLRAPTAVLVTPTGLDEELTPEAIRASRGAGRLVVEQIKQAACNIAETRAEITRTTMRYDGPKPGDEGAPPVP